MVYRVLLVDDEMPALRYIQNIVEKYDPSFAVVKTCFASETALEYLKDHPVDLLVTDINMRGQNGIELAKQVRGMYPNTHIIIISGYAEFEYAQGAIQASVDEYILKPVSVSQMRQVLQKTKEQLDDEITMRMSKIISKAAKRSAFNQQEALALLGSETVRFAFVRFGNLNLRMQETLGTTPAVLLIETEYIVLGGRDEDEQILIFHEQNLETFLTDISVYVSQHAAVPTWTVVYQSALQPVGMLPDFLKQAIPQLRRQVSIGRHQIVTLDAPGGPEETYHISTSELHQISYFATTGKSSDFKDCFLSLAATWENIKLKQIHAWTLIRQITHYLAGNIPSLESRLTDVFEEILELLLYASSYGDLLINVCSILIDENTAKDKKMSTRELYDYAIAYIDENYAKPLSMQSVCEDIGISRTYLNRLFRRYGDATFNVYMTQCRMKAAMQLLEDQPNMLLRDVAACVGYEDSSYFSKVFHQYSGLTPSQYSMRRQG